MEQQRSIQPAPALATGPTRPNCPAPALCRCHSWLHHTPAAQLATPSSPGAALSWIRVSLLLTD